MEDPDKKFELEVQNQVLKYTVQHLKDELRRKEKKSVPHLERAYSSVLQKQKIYDHKRVREQKESETVRSVLEEERGKIAEELRKVQEERSELSRLRNETMMSMQQRNPFVPYMATPQPAQSFIP